MEVSASVFHTVIGVLGGSLTIGEIATEVKENPEGEPETTKIAGTPQLSKAYSFSDGGAALLLLPL